MRALHALALLSLLAVSACGQKGPLYLPEAKPAAVPPASGAAGQANTEEEQNNANRGARRTGSGS